MNKLTIPKETLGILDVLHNAGEEAFIVGGCVRDMLLNMTPFDWDITTSATPERVKSLFRRTVDTGLAHGTVTVLKNKNSYEITTYRVDGVYEDYRRPKNVTFSRKLSEDLLRRDFTINAMAYNQEEGIVDLYGGIEDLNKGLIRCVGNAVDRFNEDALRMLRAIRFSARLGFGIEAETYQGIKTLASHIQHVSAERIQVELTKTLMSNQPWKMKELVECGLIQYIIPEFQSIVGLEQNNPYHRLPVDEHTYESLSHVELDPRLRWTMYLHDVGKGGSKTTDAAGVDHFYGHPLRSAEIALKTLRGLHFDNKTIDVVTQLIKHHDDLFEINEKSVRKAINKIGVNYFSDFLDIKTADVKSQSYEYMEKHLGQLEQVRQIYAEILKEGHCLTIKELAVNGRDLIKAGVESGIEIGDLLNTLLEYVLEEPEMNTKEMLLAKVEELRRG